MTPQSKLLLAISSLSVELTMLMCQQPDLQQRLLPHQTAVRSALVEWLNEEKEITK